MKKQKRVAFSAAALLASTAGFAAAQTIDVGANYSDNGTTYTGAGLLGEIFTGVIGSGANTTALATTSIGEGVSLSITTTTAGYFTSRGSFNQTGSTDAAGIYAGAFETRPGQPETFTLSGLTAGGVYNVAFYAGNFGNTTNGGDHQGPISGTVNGTAFSYTPASNDAPAMTANNSELFNNVAAAADGTITINTTTSSNYTAYNGIGVESVPEPSTWVSMLGGVGALAGAQAFRRRRA